MFSALQSTSGPVTDVENSVQIDALATLSIFKLVRNWPNNAVLNLELCCGAIWRQREKPEPGFQDLFTAFLKSNISKTVHIDRCFPGLLLPSESSFPQSMHFALLASVLSKNCPQLLNTLSTEADVHVAQFSQTMEFRMANWFCCLSQNATVCLAHCRQELHPESLEKLLDFFFKTETKTKCSRPRLSFLSSRPRPWSRGLHNCNILWNMAQKPQKKPFDFGGNRYHVTLR